jgi:hypothetical protein
LFLGQAADQLVLQSEIHHIAATIAEGAKPP